MQIINKNQVKLQNEITKAIQTKIDEGTYTLEQPLILLNPYKVSPLTALIIFSTKEVLTCSIKVYGKDEKSSISHTFTQSTKEHCIPVYGLYPDFDNKVRVECLTANAESTSFEYSIKTTPLPDDMDIVEVIKKSTTDELTFVTDNYTRAFDKNGEIRWYLTKDIVITKDSPVRFLKNGNIAVMNNKLLHHHCFVSGFLELSFLGKIENEYIINGANHEILELNNGDFLVVCDKDDVTTEDYIAIIDRKTGAVKYDYDFKDILGIIPQADTTYQSCLYIYKKILNKTIPDMQLLAEVKLKYIQDWLHINSVYYNEEEGYIIVSCRLKDCVIKIDAVTKEIIWIFTDSNADWCDEFYDKLLKPTNFDRPNYCYGQHSAKIIPTGELVIFDNGIFKSKDFDTAIQPNENYSRGVVYTIDEENLTITQTFSFGDNLQEKLFSCYLGNIEYLNADHYLINFGGIIFDDEGNLYQAPVVTSDESIRVKTVICEVLAGEETARYEIANVNTYRAVRNNIYSTNNNNNDIYPKFEANAKILGKAHNTQTVDINITFQEMEEFKKMPTTQILDYTINEIADLGERIVFDITFNNCENNEEKYILFASNDNSTTLAFEFKPDSTIGINKCTLECLGDNYKVGLLYYGEFTCFEKL